MEKYLGIILILTVTFFVKSFFQPTAVLGTTTTETLPADRQVLPVNQPVVTESSFTEKLQEETTNIPKKIVYEDDPETEAGTDTVLEEGVEGKKTVITKIIYYKSTGTSGVDSDSSEVEYSREIIATETIDPKDKIISRGTKIVWRTLDTPNGEIRYWKKMRVWATHYDSHYGFIVAP